MQDSENIIPPPLPDYHMRLIDSSQSNASMSSFVDTSNLDFHDEDLNLLLAIQASLTENSIFSIQKLKNYDKQIEKIEQERLERDLKSEEERKIILKSKILENIAEKEKRQKFFNILNKSISYLFRENENLRQNFNDKLDEYLSCKTDYILLNNDVYSFFMTFHKEYRILNEFSEEILKIVVPKSFEEEAYDSDYEYEE